MSQTQQILEHLEKGYSLTPLESIEKFGCYALAQRIQDIRLMGYTVYSERFQVNGKEVARYQITPVNAPQFRQRGGMAHV